MKMSGHHCLASAYVALLFCAQLVQPILAQGQNATLEAGKWPLTMQQVDCVGEAAAASEAFADFTAMVLLVGAGMLYGEGNETAGLLQADGTSELLARPLRGIIGGYEGWLEETVHYCGLPEFHAPGEEDGALGSAIAWWNTISEADLLTMANGTSAARAAEAAAGGRRLLWSIRNVFDLDLGDKAATMAAGALGTGLGFASGMLANELGTAITVAGVAAFATASLPVMIVGVGGAIALGMVASSLAQEAMDKGAEMLYDQFESDAVVEAAFKQGQQVGGVTAGLYQMTKLGKAFKNFFDANKASEASKLKAADYLEQAKNFQKDPKFNPDKGSDITKLQKLRNQKNVNSQLAAEQADKARQIAAPSAGDAISGVIGAKQAYESFSKLKQSSGTECSVSTHTLIDVFGGMNHLDTVEGVGSSDECCLICKLTSGCTLYQWCRADAARCDSRPGMQYSNLAFPANPSDCLLYAVDKPERYKDHISDNDPGTPWDTGMLVATMPSSISGVGSSTDVSGSAGGRDASGSAITGSSGVYGYAQQNQDCEGTCAGQGKVVIDGGRAGNALCYVLYEGAVYYGTWSRVVAFQGPTNVCYYQDSEGTWTEDADFGCACIDSPAEVAWKPWADCVTGSAAAAHSPAICRYHKYQDPGTGTGANYWMGWILSDTCFTSNMDYGPNGEVVNGITGTMGGENYGLQTLCKNGAPADLTAQILTNGA